MTTRKNLRTALATAAAAALTGGLLAGAATGTAAAAPASGKAPAKGAKYADDYNGDGIRDFAVSGFGDFSVQYGTAKGGVTKPKWIDQDSPGIPGKLGGEHEGESFGEKMATADFNQDGYADLAVSDYIEKVGKRDAQGLTMIIWGSGAGLGSKATVLPPKKPRTEGFSGVSLATGDFNGDGTPDLAVGDRDSVSVHRGPFSATGGKTGAVTVHRPAGGKKIVPLGLVAGNVTKDKATDLYVLGLTDEGKKPKSVTWFLKGGDKTVTGGTYTAVSGEPNLDPQGVVADFDKNGYGDLVLGDEDHKNYAGSVRVLPGGANGPSGASYRITQDTAGIATAATKNDLFGGNLSAGDVDGDGYPDLAVSAPGEKVGAVKHAGGVHLLRGGPKGLTGAKSQWFTQSTAGVPGKAEELGFFGQHLALRDVDADGRFDLYVSNADEVSALIKGAKSGLDVKNARSVSVSADFVR